ncbi:ATP-grasp peptide maturase system methyltransferase [Micromonospora sp. WMMA1363]|uniref:ATP-grasp peptide maturase system methyltransferase n=1 Tax=Micromonospora sp. WMMA1363 TaxID=3053985 RepID=UPI00259D1A5F|nr:ATP-grasp peptide maturase system methyltransferase [Micromonospora sp. WMMA1363]MDM4721428.1 ATP-grasp peptide maturase system methyltransferase [Micromonospora sp. WMMA1363]
MTLTVDYRQLRQHLVTRLHASGHLTSPTVAGAFASVPRHPFAPAVYDVDSRGQVGDVLHAARPDHHAAYLAAVYGDEAIVTQISADGRPTSSSTQPGVMAVMLEALDPQPGMTVLEIGTGTGYNAALLAHLVGDQAVTSVDIDPGLVTNAAAALDHAGYRPTLAAADGLSGYPPRAPYDRLIATCSVRRVPVAWLRQTNPGGLILANLSYGVVPLRVDDTGTGHGRFLPQIAAFIEARPADGPIGPTVADMVTRCMSGTGTTSPGSERDVELFTDPGGEFFWRLTGPSIYQCTLLPDGEEVHCLVDADTGSWARIHTQGPTVTVVQSGPRQLWHAVATACRRWADAGRPTHDHLVLQRRVVTYGGLSRLR